MENKFKYYKHAWINSMPPDSSESLYDSQLSEALHVTTPPIIEGYFLLEMNMTLIVPARQAFGILSRTHSEEWTN